MKSDVTDMSEILPKSKPKRPVRVTPEDHATKLMSLDGTTCSQCFMDVHQYALTCPYCQATRKTMAKTKWTPYREARRTDIVVAVLAAWFFASIITFFLLMATLPNALKSSTTTPATTCTRYSAAWPNC